MAWHNSDLARPDALYRDHFQRAEERLQVNALTTLQRDKAVVPPITRTRASNASTTRSQRVQVTLPTAVDVETVRRNAMADRGQPMPPITRAADDSALTHAPGQPIARPAKDATPGAASSSSKPRTIGSTLPGRPTGQAFHSDGHTSLGSALPKPGSAGGEALRQLDALHTSLERLPASSKNVKPPTQAEVDLARQHARTSGCERCNAFLVGLARGAKGQGEIEQNRRQQQARALQRNLPPTRWPRGRS